MEFNSENIVYSSRTNWDELVNITFVDHENYLSLNALVYEDEIEIEWNDQVNYVSILKSDFKFEIVDKQLRLEVTHVVNQNNIRDLSLCIHFRNGEVDELKIALAALTGRS
jgi:hypothetical protein